MNWEHEDIFALIVVKKKKHIATLDRVDPRYQFPTVVIKWKNIGTNVMKEGCFQHTRNGLMSKDKQGAMSGDFKRIFYYIIETSNIEKY